MNDPLPSETQTASAAEEPYEDGEAPAGLGRLVLSERDFERFLQILDDPAPPTPRLVAALRAYRQLQAEFPGNNF